MTLFIVDDEEKTRKNLCELIDWSSNGVEVLGCAENGRDALEFLTAFPADLVMTDVRMPVMDGLELIRQLKSRGIGGKFIVFSGYDEFDYAKQAIRYGVSEYLLKPCSRKEILETALRVKALVDLENEQNRQRELLKAQMEEEKPFLREKYLGMLVTGKSSSSDLKEKLAFLEVSLESSQYTAAIAVIQPSAGGAQDEKQTELMDFGVKRLFVQSGLKGFSAEFFTVEDKYVFLIKHGEPLAREKLTQALEQLLKTAEHQLGAKLIFGVGGSYLGCDFAKDSYQEARRAVDRLFWSTDSKISFYAQEESSPAENSYPFSCEREILTALKQTNRLQLENAIHSFYLALENQRTPRERALQYQEILKSALFRFCIEIGLPIDSLMKNGQGKKPPGRLSDGETIQKTALDLLGLIEQRQLENPVIAFVVQYIEQHYSQEISRETLAEKAFVSPSYLSTLFRQCMGMNFSDYLNRVRIRNACEILRRETCKIYEVALSVGFNDERYFSQVFKKIEGLTPAEYRSLSGKAKNLSSRLSRQDSSIVT